jgi:hypothetical protein
MKTGKNMLTIQLDATLKRRLRIAAAKQGLLMSEAARRALLDWLRKGK